MSLYLIRFRYTPESWAELIKNPSDRRDAVNALAESIGGSLKGLWFSFGAQDPEFRSS